MFVQSLKIGIDRESHPDFEIHKRESPRKEAGYSPPRVLIASALIMLTGDTSFSKGTLSLKAVTYAGESSVSAGCASKTEIRRDSSIADAKFRRMSLIR